MSHYQKMKEGESIREVFSSPSEVDSFIRNLIQEKEQLEVMDEKRRLAFAQKAESFRVELENEMYRIQKRHGLVIKDHLSDLRKGY